jgi:diaminopimelate epimerase
VAGVPHFVVPVTDVESVPLADWAPALRSHATLGSAGANVDFVAARSDGRVAMRTWERGVEGETLACGSGAMATALWALLAGAAQSPVTIRTQGGDDLVVELAGEGGTREAVLVGPATAVFTGEWQERSQ